MDSPHGDDGNYLESISLSSKKQLLFSEREDNPASKNISKTINFSPVITPNSSENESENSENYKRNIPLIFLNLVQFECCTRKEHRLMSQKIKDHPRAYQSSSVYAAKLTFCDTLYLAQVLEMWSTMSKCHRTQFVELVVVESSIANINNMRDSDVIDARSSLRQDREYQNLSDDELDKKISYLKSLSKEDVRALIASSVKYQGLFAPIEPLFSSIDRLTCGYAFILFCVVLFCGLGWVLWRIFYALLLSFIVK